MDGNGDPITIYDPTTGQPFPNNKIESGRINPEVQEVLNLYPLPNFTGAFGYNYATQLSFSEPRREDILRLDHQTRLPPHEARGPHRGLRFAGWRARFGVPVTGTSILILTNAG